MLDFDQPFDRTKSRSEKWDKAVLAKKFGRDDVLPFWIADMDFAASPAIVERLADRIGQRTFGYETVPQSLVDAILQWNKVQHDWTICHDSVCFTAGTMHSITQMLRAFTDSGEGIMIQPPVYFQFESAIQNTGRKVVANPLRLIDGRYEMDFDDLEQKAVDPSTKVLLLCNPHNPVGRVWSVEELQRVAEICGRHDVLVIADEVHGDFVFAGHKYTPFPSLSRDVAERSVSCLSPAKAFNIPSIAARFAVIANDSLRSAFDAEADKSLLNHVNAFSMVATESAYRATAGSSDSAVWLQNAIESVQRNADILCEAVDQRIPGVTVIRPEGTFLAWLDFRQLGVSTEQLKTLLVQDAGLALKAGHSFGPTGEGFCRMSIACSGTLLETAISRLEQAVARFG